MPTSYHDLSAPISDRITSCRNSNTINMRQRFALAKLNLTLQTTCHVWTIFIDWHCLKRQRWIPAIWTPWFVFKPSVRYPNFHYVWRESLQPLTCFFRFVNHILYHDKETKHVGLCRISYDCIAIQQAKHHVHFGIPRWSPFSCDSSYVIGKDPSSSFEIPHLTIRLRPIQYQNVAAKTTYVSWCHCINVKTLNSLPPMPSTDFTPSKCTIYH